MHYLSIGALQGSFPGAKANVTQDITADTELQESSQYGIDNTQLELDDDGNFELLLCAERPPGKPTFLLWLVVQHFGIYSVWLPVVFVVFSLSHTYLLLQKDVKTGSELTETRQDCASGKHFSTEKTNEWRIYKWNV